MSEYIDFRKAYRGLIRVFSIPKLVPWRYESPGKKAVVLNGTIPHSNGTETSITIYNITTGLGLPKARYVIPSDDPTGMYNFWRNESWQPIILCSNDMILWSDSGNDPLVLWVYEFEG